MNMSSLIRRIASLKSEMSTWGSRASNANIQIAGKRSPYTYEECVQRLAEARTSLIKSKTALAIANATTMITYHIVDATGSYSVTTTITEAILTLAEIKAELAQLSILTTLDADSVTEEIWSGYGTDRTKTTLEKKCAMTTRQRDDLVDKLKDRFASINAAVEAANHSVEVSV